MSDMSYPDELDLVEAMHNGPKDGETLESLLDGFRRLVIEATLNRERTQMDAAHALGLTREWVYKLRKRLGILIENQNQAKEAESNRRALEIMRGDSSG